MELEQVGTESADKMTNPPTRVKSVDGYSLPRDQTPVGSCGVTSPTRLLQAREVAAMLGVTAGWVYAQSRANRIPTVKLGARYYRYRREAIEEWVAAQEVGTS